MSKNTETKFVGQPIFKQIVNLTDAVNIKSLELISHSMIVFDRAYNNYHQFALWCTLIAQLLLTVIQKIAQTKKAFSVVAALVRMHLISMLDVNELLRNTNRSYQIARGLPDGTMQLNLFGVNSGGGHFGNLNIKVLFKGYTEDKLTT